WFSFWPRRLRTSSVARSSPSAAATARYGTWKTWTTRSRGGISTAMRPEPWTRRPGTRERHVKQLTRDDAHHELARVLAPEQHAESDRRLRQPLQHMQPLSQAAVPTPRREPGPGLVVTFAVVEHQETLHAPMRGRQPTKIAHAIRLGSMRLRDAAAQYHACALTQMRQGRVQRG